MTGQTEIGKKFAKYAGLSVCSMIGISCYILADTYFVSKGLGADGLTALNLAIPMYDFIHGIGLMLGMGGATRYSVCRSQRRQKAADEMYTNTLYLAVIFSVFLMMAGIFGSEQIASLLGADETVFAMTNTYLKVLMIFAPMFILNDVLLCFVRNDGGPQLSMAATVTGSVSNIILDYIFIFPCGMGMFGAVFATGISPVASILVMSPHWMRKEKGFHLIKTGLIPKTAGVNMALGFPSFVTQVSSGVVMITFNSIILNLEGNIGVAAYGVIANISLVVTAVYTGIAQGMQPVVSQAYGQNRWEDIRRVLRYAMAAMIVFSVVIYGVIFLAADQIAFIFNSENNKMLQEIAVNGLKLYFTSVLFVGFNVILAVYFTSVERAIPAQIISLMRGLIVIVPAAFLMAKILQMNGVWLAFPATELMTALVGAALYRLC